MKKSTCIITGIIAFLAGLAFGIILAPAKNGISIGNNSGNYFGTPNEDYDEDFGSDAVPF